jgi:hypothetical protein
MQRRGQGMRRAGEKFKIKTNYAAIFTLRHSLFEPLLNEGLNFLKKFFAVIRMGFQTDRLGQVEAEDAHDGLGIHCISARNQVNIEIILGNSVDEHLHIVNRVQQNINGFHGLSLLLC